MSAITGLLSTAANYIVPGVVGWAIGSGGKTEPVTYNINVEAMNVETLDNSPKENQSSGFLGSLEQYLPLMLMMMTLPGFLGNMRGGQTGAAPVTVYT